MTGLAKFSNDELVRRFEEISVAQFDAIRVDNNKVFRRLYKQMDEVDNELRARGTEARLMLRRLYDHPNPQVRLKAAIRTLGVAPGPARAVLDAIRASREQPQALDAGVTIVGLDDGSFVPT